MADNRIYVKCRWCCEGNASEWLKAHPYEKSYTLARHGIPDQWQARIDGFAEFMENHMHRDEPEWWTSGCPYNPFDFEYEDTNEEAKERQEKIRDETGCPPFLSAEEAYKIDAAYRSSQAGFDPGLAAVGELAGLVSFDRKYKVIRDPNMEITAAVSMAMSTFADACSTYCLIITDPDGTTIRVYSNAHANRAVIGIVERASGCEAPF